MGRPNRRRLRLFQPEPHVHLPVHGFRDRQVLLGLRAVAGASVELAEAETAVGDERAHAELVGQGHSLEVPFCRLNVGRLLTCRDFGEGPECPGLVATLFVLSGQIESMPRKVDCVRYPICDKTSLAEPGDPERIVDRASDGTVLLHDLLQEIHAVGNTPGLGICVTEMRGHVGEPHRNVPVATKPEPTFEHRDRSFQVAFAERHKAGTEARADQAERVNARLGDSEPLVRAGDCFGELATLRKAPG